jgi:hypothetical protein
VVRGLAGGAFDKDEDVAVGVGDGERFFLILDGDSGGLELLFRGLEAGDAEEQARLGAGPGELNPRAWLGGDADVEAGVGVGDGHAHLLVKLAGGGEVGDSELDAFNGGRDAVGEQVESLVERVFGAGHVLGELGVAAVGIGEGGDEVAGAGLVNANVLDAAGGDGGDVGGDVVILIADVEPAEGLGGRGLGIVLEELAVVDLDEDFGDFSVFGGEGKGLLETELEEEGLGTVEVGDAVGDVGDAGDGGGLRRLGVGEGDGGGESESEGNGREAAKFHRKD